MRKELIVTRDLWRCDKCYHWNSIYDDNCTWCGKTDGDDVKAESNEIHDKIKDQAVTLWSDLQQADLSLDKYEELREFIINLFLEDK